MISDLRRVVVLTGAYGSGKTELSIALATAAAAAHRDQAASGRVALADIDVLKPYFRSREASNSLRELGVTVIAPTGGLTNSDLPILPAELRGMVIREDMRIFLDVGGDPVGARALGSISDVVSAQPYDMLLVINRHRPFMDSIARVVETAHQIVGASSLSISGVISNTHMMDETTVDDIQWGLELSHAVAEKLGVGVRMVGIPDDLELTSSQEQAFPPVFRIRRWMKPRFMGGVVLDSPIKRDLGV